MTTAPKDSAVVSTSQLFQAADADVLIQSSDNVQFHLHKRHLEFATGGFPPADTPTDGQVVHLSEPSDVLEILFQFVYPRRLPTFDRGPGMDDYEVVLKVAEAAEKYEVYCAIAVCQLKSRYVGTYLVLCVDFRWED
ncbi:hypothetical protein GYMLUDRAFT_689253 [Collybiopsis luxurians FD-317 M1]|uniref:BTB domain-containing protein n=1 Tax=Collybiopsis luxurians FD-317 M1 TaxID=944289 RepID=A0A0D0B5Q7_9AGAR|nr:hypothetical protein GYMLUDRAFT_689253 [Collybiopsis luxurians FD-317 M1]